MCNHYRNTPAAMVELPKWKKFLGAPQTNLPLPDADAWPKRPALVIRHRDTCIGADIMSWGVPLTLPGKRPGTTLTKHVTNVRNLASPFWRSMLTAPAQRCLVPFSSFAEPRPGGGEAWFAVTDQPVAAFAGIWRPTDAGAVFAFLTCEPNPLVAPIHPKAMPVILHPEDYDRWLSTDYADACALAVPFPSQLMESPDRG